MPPQPANQAQQAKPANRTSPPPQQGARPQARPAQANEAQALVIEGFDPNDLAKKLSEEAAIVVPAEFQPQDKKYVVDFVYRFCVMCGEALVKDSQKHKLNAPQVSLITQLIGEWTFHKSIDLIRGGIPIDLRETILHKVAFTVYELAKEMVSNNLPNDQIIQLVEAQVKKAFKAALDDLKAKGRISEDLENQAMSQSNIDVMQQQHRQEMQKNQEGEEAEGSDLSDLKIIKLAALAVLVKKLPEDKAKAIYEKLSKSEANALAHYAKMPDLEAKVDKRILMSELAEIKGILPEPKLDSASKINTKLFKIVKSCDKKEISNIIDNERPTIKQFVLSAYTKDETTMPLHIGNIICKYLEEKIKDYDNKKKID